MTEDSVEFDLSSEQADKVLAIAQENGMWNGNVLSASKEQDARNFVNNAIRAVRAGAAKNNPIVLQVLGVANIDLEGDLPATPAPTPKADPNPTVIAPASTQQEQPKLSKDQVVALLTTGTALGLSNDDVVTIAGIPLREVNAADFADLLAAIAAAGSKPPTSGQTDGIDWVNKIEPEPEKPLESNAFTHAQVEGPVSGSDIKALKQLAEQVIDVETVQRFSQENYSKDLEELTRNQFNTIYKMLCEAGSIDYPGNDDEVNDVAAQNEAIAERQEETPPFEPDPPKTEAPATRGEKGNRRRTRASDGTLHFKDELATYEANLKQQAEADATHIVPEGNGEAMVSEGAPVVHGQESLEKHDEQVTAKYVAPIDQRSGSLIDEYKYKREMAEAQARKDNLPIPPDIEGQPEPLPADFTTLSGPEVRRYHSLYHSYLSRASYLLACEESDLDAAHHIYLDHYNRALRTHLGSEAKDTKVTVAKTAASLDDDVVEWRDKEASHQTNVRLLKQLRDYYDSSCTRLSREASMRQAEIEGTPRSG